MPHAHELAPAKPTARLACLSIFWITILGLPALGAPSQAAGADELPQRLAAYLDACEQVLHFNGAVLVRHQGQMLVSRGIGLANFEHQVPNTPHTKFRIGSITKSFTALLILQQVQAGKLALDDPINRHLDKPAPAWEPVTIHHLLSHTAGIHNFTDSLDYLAKRAVLGKPQQVLAMFRDKPLEFTPGEKYQYSNSGYILLGLILEKVTGLDYAELVRQRVFEPLGMADSGYDEAATVVPDRAQGYSRQTKGFRNAAFVDMRGVSAAGALYSSVEDLAKYDAALAGDALLSTELRDKLFTPVKNDYAYGWINESRDGRQVIWHNGGIDGFSANLTRLPGENTCVAVLGNFDDGQPDRIARDIVDLLTGGEYRLPREHVAIQLDPARHEGLLGAYQLAPELVLKVMRGGQRLYLQLTGQPRVEMFAESDCEFFLKAVDAQLTFVRNDAGRATQVTLHQGGRHLVAPRRESVATDSSSPNAVPPGNASPAVPAASSAN